MSNPPDDDSACHERQGDPAPVEFERTIVDLDERARRVTQAFDALLTPLPDDDDRAALPRADDAKGDEP